MKTKLTLFVTVLAAVLSFGGCGKSGRSQPPKVKTEPSANPTRDALKEGNNAAAILDTSTLENGLVAHYKFDGNTHDATGNSNKGEITGAAKTAKDRHGNTDKSYDFNSGGYVILGNTDGLALSEFTTSVWFKWRSNHPDHIYRTLLAKGQGVYHTHMNYMLLVTDTDQGDASGKVVAVVGHGDELAEPLRATNFPSNMSVADDNWHHAVFTFSSKNGSGSLHIDGILNITKNKIPPVFMNKNQDATIGIWGGFERLSPLFPKNGVNYGIWDGHIDDIRIYNRALSTEEVKALYNLEKPKGK